MSNFITSIRGGFRGRGRGFGDTGRGSDFGDPDSGCARSPSRQRQRSPVQQILRNRLDDVEAPGSFTYSYSLPRRSRGNPLSPRGVARGLAQRALFFHPYLKTERDSIQPARFQSNLYRLPPQLPQNNGFRSITASHVGQARGFNQTALRFCSSVTVEDSQSDNIWPPGNPWGFTGNKKFPPGTKSLLQPEYLLGDSTSNSQVSTNPQHNTGLQTVAGSHLTGNVQNPFNNHGPIHASTPSFSCHSTIPAQTTLVPNVLHQRMTVQPLVHIRSNPAVPGISLVSVNTAGFNNTMQTVSVINPLVPRTPAPVSKITPVTSTTNDFNGMFIKSSISYNNNNQDLRYAPPNAVSEVGTSKNSNLNELKSHTTNSQSPASVVVKPQPPPPPKIGGSRMEPTKEPVDMDSVSYELQFIDLSNSYNLDVKSSPSIKIDENGKKTFAFTIEFGNKFGKTDSAQGQYFPSINEARENAYRFACQRVENVFSTSESQLGHMLVKKRPFRSQDSWSQASVDDNCESLALRPSLPKIPALLDSAFPGPTPNPATPEAKTITQLLPPCSRSKQPFENKFKDYMDILHMQCWLKTKTRYDDKGNRLFGVEIEIQSYDKKFHQFDYGEYFVVEDTAKENAFETACRKLDLMFPKELQEFIEQDTSSRSQRKFMDLRSTLGLTVRCLPEIKRDSHGQLTYAFNIEFCRGGVVEIVYGDFGPDEKNSKEKAFELATWRVKYLYGPELDLANNKPLLLPPHEPTKPLSKDPDISFVDWNPSNRKFYNPHYSGNMPSSIGQRTDKPSYAMVSPRVQQPETPVPAWSPLPDHTSHVEYNRTYEYRFKEITDILNVEYFLRKIPKFEGGHKIFAFEITFQGIRGNLSRQQSVGEYFRDEGMAKESAFKYACEQLNS